MASQPHIPSPVTVGQARVGCNIRAMKAWEAMKMVRKGYLIKHHGNPASQGLGASPARWLLIALLGTILETIPVHGMMEQAPV